MKSVSLRVRKIYFDQIVAGTKDFELRATTPYWDRILDPRNPPQRAVFLCGRQVHRRMIIGIRKNLISDLLLRVSEQGWKDLQLDKYDYVYTIWLGEVMN